MDSLLTSDFFPCLNSQIKDKLKSVRLLSVYGFEGEEVMFANNDDKVFVSGRNRFGALGLGHKIEQISSIHLNQFLSRKQVIDISFGRKHWIALTSSGQCYVWGDNTFGQLGAPEVQESLVPQLLEPIQKLNVVKVSCGDNHTLVLTSDERIYGWGHNKFGQLADNKSDKHLNPILIEISEPIKSISCGLNHSMALTSSGKVYIWGLAVEGRLPICNGYRYYWPQLVKGLGSKIIKQITCGPNHSLLLSTDGIVFAFGDNSNGQIGNESVDNQYIPFKVKSDLSFKQIIANKVNDMSLGITSDGKCFVWGLTETQIFRSPEEIAEELSGLSIFDIYAKYAKIKITFQTVKRFSVKPILSVKVWQRIQSLNKSMEKFAPNKLSETSENVITNQEVFGHHIDDLISWNNLCPNISLDESLRTSLEIVITLNSSQVIFITSDDRVYSYGWNRNGILGLGDKSHRFDKPELNTYLSGKRLIHISHGKDHCIGLTARGQCYGWGDNRFGQLGIGSLVDTWTPQLISEPKNLFIVQVCCGELHSMALSSTGEVFAWGYNTFGELGDQTYYYRTAPKLICICNDIVSISCGKHHSLALNSAGHVYVWGINEHGQLGRPREQDIRVGRHKAVCNTPSLVTGIHCAVKKAVCGADHTLLLTRDGHVYAYGMNNCGQVGVGSTEDQFEPFQLNTRLKIKDIVSETNNVLSLAITEDNQHFVWGLVDSKIVIRPKFHRISDEKSVFDIYLKCSKTKTLFKTLVVSEGHEYCFTTQKNSQELSSANIELVPITENSNESKISDNCDHFVESLFNSTDTTNQSIVSESTKTSFAVLKNHLIKSYNNPKEFDFKFVSEDKVICCQKAFLEFRNKKFWLKVQQKVIDNKIIIDSDKFEAMEAFIKFLYGLELEVNNNTVLGLQSMAEYFDEKELMDLCVKYIKQLEDIVATHRKSTLAINTS